MINKFRGRLADLRLAVLGHQTGHPPGWLRLEKLAFCLAKTEDDDGRAVAALRDEVQSQPIAVAQRARERIKGRVWCYATDRAGRLIDAAINGSPLKPVDAKWKDLFAREAKLGKMPLYYAFPEIVAYVPEIGHIVRKFDEGLVDIRKSAEGKNKEHRSIHLLLMDAQHEIDQVIGPKSRNPDPLLRSYIPRNIVYRWLHVLSGDPPRYSRDGIYFVPFPGRRDDGET